MAQSRTDNSTDTRDRSAAMVGECDFCAETVYSARKKGGWTCDQAPVGGDPVPFVQLPGNRNEDDCGR